VIEAIVRFSIAHRVSVIIAALVLGLGAVVLGARLDLDALPDVTGNQVLILTTAAGFTPEEVELRVTKPIEAAVSGLPGVERERSVSRYGLSAVTVLFEDAVDPYRARQLVAERLATVSGELPSGVDAPALGPYTGGLGEVFHFTLSSPDRSTSEILEIAQLDVAPLLRSTPGVVEVNSWGGARRSFDLRLDPARLGAQQLTLSRVGEAVATSVGSVPGASVSSGRGQTILRGVFRPQSAAELGAIVVETKDRAVRLGELGSIEDGQLPRLGAATARGGGETVYVMVQMLRGANALSVLSGVKERMVEVERILPADVKVRLIYDRSALVYRTLRTVFTSLVEGGALVGVILFLLLGSVRAGLITAFVIPLSMLGATSGMVLLGVPGNLMSLGAIDFGLLVDGAVVMVEAYFHTLHGRRDSPEDALVQVARPVFFSVAIIMLVYVPVLALSGVDGKMFRPMATTVILALGTALILSLTFVPAAARIFLSERDLPKVEPFLVRIGRRVYFPILRWAMARPRLVLGLSLGLLLVGLSLLLSAETAFVPQLDEGDLVVQTTRKPDISLTAAVQEATAMEAALEAQIPEIEQVVSRIGSPAVATDVMGIEQADVFVGLAPKAQWRPGLSREALIAEMAEVIDQSSPGAEVAFTQPIQMRMNELIGGDTTDVSVSIFGSDLGELRRIAERAAALIEKVEGVADVRINVPPAVPLLEVRPNPLAAQQLGLSPQEVLATVQAVEQGLVVAETYDGRLRVPIRLRGLSPVSAQGLPEVMVPTRSGVLVPLSRVATVNATMTPSLISHEDGVRRVVVGLNVRGRSLGEVAVAADRALEPLRAQSSGTRWVWGGQFETFNAAKKRMGLIIPVVLVSILAVLAFTFGSLRPALLIFANVPFAGVGGIALLSLRDLPVSISAAVGFIALSGIAVLNGVVLMSQILVEERGGHLAFEAARRAAQSRMRPVLMTASVAALGFLPMTLATGVGSEVQRPLATVVVGGLFTSTLLTLVIVPALYGWLFGDRTKR